jgi:hypothetical protein
MIPTLEEMAQELNIPPENLWKASLRAYIARELRLIELDIADLQDRYDVLTPKQLEASIQSGDIYSHPAWEELIEWENLLAHRERLGSLQASLVSHI